MTSELTVSTRIAYSKDWCESVAFNYDRVARKQAKLDELQRSADGIKAVRYDRIGGVGCMEHGDDAVASRLETIERERASVEDARLYAIDGAREFDMALDAMRNQTYALLLAMKYEQRMSWKDIADELGYSESHVRYYMHNAALVELYDLMPSGMKLPPAI